MDSKDRWKPRNPAEWVTQWWGWFGTIRATGTLLLFNGWRFFGVDVDYDLEHILASLTKKLNNCIFLSIIKRKKNKSLHLNRMYTESKLHWSSNVASIKGIALSPPHLKYIQTSSERNYKGLMLMWSSGWASEGQHWHGSGPTCFTGHSLSALMTQCPQCVGCPSGFSARPAFIFFIPSPAWLHSQEAWHFFHCYVDDLRC